MSFEFRVYMEQCGRGLDCFDSQVLTQGQTARVRRPEMILLLQTTQLMVVVPLVLREADSQRLLGTAVRQ